MSSFTGKIILEKVKNKIGYSWEVYTSFEYHVGDENSFDIIIIPKGFLTDFASVPRIFWAILPPDGEYTAAAIVHDFLYSKKERPRKLCDDIFLEAMTVLEVPKWKRKIMYRAVRMFGWIPWQKK